MGTDPGNVIAMDRQKIVHEPGPRKPSRLCIFSWRDSRESGRSYKSKAERAMFVSEISIEKAKVSER
jgi:hypothetical protein